MGNRQYFAVAANLLAGSFAMPFVIASGNGDMRKGFAFLGILCGVLYAVNYLVVYFATRGYEPSSAELESPIAATQPKQKVSFKEVFSNGPWLVVLLAYFIINVAISIAGTTGLFYAQYNLGNVDYYSTMNVIAIVGALLVYPFLSWLVKKFGNARLIAIGTALAAISYFVRFMLHDANLLIIYVGYFLGNFGQSMANSVVMLVIYDSFIYMHHKTGKPAPEALLVSGYSVAYKVGMAISTPVAGWLLDSVPYVAGVTTQDASVLQLFFNENTLFPAVAFFLSFCLGLLLINYDKKMQTYKAMEVRESQADN